MKIKSIIGFVMFLLATNLAGQTDTLATVVFEKSEAESLKTIGHYWSAATLWISAFAAILLPMLSFFALRSRIDKWADASFSKKASEKVGVDWGIMKNLVDERHTLLLRRSAMKIAIVNQKTGEKGSLSDLITSYGFPRPEFFTLEDTEDNSKKHFGTAFRKGDFNLLLFDNEDGAIEEEIIVKLIEDNQLAFKANILWYTKEQVKSYGIMTKQGVGFVKQPSRFVIELDDRLLNI